MRYFSTSTWKVVSFYKVSRLNDEKALPHLKEKFTAYLNARNAKGRIYVSREGINGQTSIPENEVESFKSFISDTSAEIFAESNDHPQAPLLYNVGLTRDPSPMFPKLRVAIKEKLVSDCENYSPFVACNMVEKGSYLEPREFHDSIKKSENPLILDVRNYYEYDVGRFRGAVLVHAKFFKDQLPKILSFLLEKNIKKNHEIFMYCTGGIRCTKTLPYLKEKGLFSNIKMLKGGIINYANFIRDSGEESLFIGKNYTFDDRRGERVTPDILTNCRECGSPDDTLVNCSIPECDLFMVLCLKCQEKYKSNSNIRQPELPLEASKGKFFSREKRCGWTCSPECNNEFLKFEK